MGESNVISLISEDGDKNLTLNESALDIIKNLTGDIAVCVIVGQYRFGKFFLLSHLLEHFSGDQSIILET